MGEKTLKSHNIELEGNYSTILQRILLQS